MALAFLAAVGCNEAPPAMMAPPTTMAGAGAAGSAAPGTGGMTAGAAGMTAAAGGGAAGTMAAAGTGAAAGGGAAGTMAAAGTGAAGMGAAGGGAPAGPATFTAVYDAIWGASATGRCVFCHGMAPSDGTNGNLGMVMNKDALYAAIVGKPAQGSMCMGKGMYVVAGQPEMSLLLHKLKDEMPPCGMRMPPGAMVTDEAIQLLSDWIMAGAKND